MLNDDLFARSGGEFPYRRYLLGTSNNIKRLFILVNQYEPEYDINGFQKETIVSKVVSRFNGNDSIFDFFEVGPKNIPQKIDWDLNSVIDQYTETARMSSPGYGKDHSPNDLWFKTSFSKLRDRILLGKNTLKDAREAIYKKGEVRLAYVTDSIGLYNWVRSNLLVGSSSSPPVVIDITAFGDRLTAACATGFEYIGIDPDPNLVDGINRLTLDLKAINPRFKANTYTVPIEHFSSERQVDFVSLSPPPYAAEPYTGGDRQVHKVYKDFRHWFYGFIQESLLRANEWLQEGGILGFSVLDRDHPYKIVYTEAMILLAMKLGFKPVQIFTLSSDSGTPWWLFRKTSGFSSDLFDKMYPELIISDIQKNNRPSVEYLRYLASNYVTDTCKNHNVFIRPEKTRDYLVRIMMSKIPDHNQSDYLFPDSDSGFMLNDGDFNNIDDIILPIVIQTPDAGYRTVIGSNSFTSPSDILMDLFNAVIGYLHWIQCTVEYQNFDRNVEIAQTSSGIVNLFVERRYQISTIGFLRKHTLFTESCFDSHKVYPKSIILWSTNDRGATKENISSYIRYDAAGDTAHHLTRPDLRINAIAKIAGVPNKDHIVDLFATPSNRNSKLYTSVYPDVDPESLGNFFTFDGGRNKVFMANPPPYPYNEPNEAIVRRLMDVYLDKHTDRIIFYSTTVWNDEEGANYIKRIQNGSDPMFDDFENYYILSTIWAEYKEYVRGVYILDHSKYPTYDMSKGKEIKSRRNTESIGLILSGNHVDLSQLKLLSSGNHVSF